jgi:hypothetical protein
VEKAVKTEKTGEGEFSIEPIRIFRGAEQTEKLRMSAATAGKTDSKAEDYEA